MNLRLSKTISFGKEVQRRGVAGKGGSLGDPRSNEGIGGGAPGTNRHPSLTFSVMAINLLNNVNLGPRVGVLGSPLFGQSNSTVRISDDVSQAANHRIDFQVVLTM